MTRDFRRGDRARSIERREKRQPAAPPGDIEAKNILLALNTLDTPPMLADPHNRALRGNGTVHDLLSPWPREIEAIAIESRACDGPRGSWESERQEGCQGRRVVGRTFRSAAHAGPKGPAYVHFAYVATTLVVMPPRAVNAPVTVIRRG